MDILLICFGFPPVPGIGGRRWAKFAKYLARKGNTLHVMSAENPTPHKSSPWLSDVEGNANIHIHRLPAQFPGVLTTIPTTILQKVQYRLALRKMRKSVRGDYLDRAGLWKEQLVQKGNELIAKHGLKNVIVTGAPYHLCYYACQLKKQHPDINFIVDLRDPWTFFNSEWSFGALDAARQAEEREMEREVVATADHLITVADTITDKYKTMFPNVGTQFHTIKNGFDPEDFSQFAPATDNRSENDSIRFIFTGSLYDNLDYLLDPLYESLLKIRAENPDLYQRIRIDFYGNYPTRYEEKRNQQGIEAVHFNGTIPLEQVYREVKSSDFCTLFLIRSYAFSMSTKFYEYVSQQKKIVVFSEPGEMPDFIVRNGLGYAVFPDTFHADFLSVLKSYGTPDFHKISDFDISASSVEVLAGEVELLLQ